LKSITTRIAEKIIEKTIDVEVEIILLNNG